MKLVISCLLMCACFWSSLERVLARAWDLAGKDRPLVSGAARPWVLVPLTGEASREGRGLFEGFLGRGGLEVLCRSASLRPFREAGSAWLGVFGKELLSPFFCGGSSELLDAGKGSWLGMKLASDLFLVTGLESVIFFQIFNQEKVRQEKIRQHRKNSRVIQKTASRPAFSSPMSSQLCTQAQLSRFVCGGPEPKAARLAAAPCRDRKCHF